MLRHLFCYRGKQQLHLLSVSHCFHVFVNDWLYRGGLIFCFHIKHFDRVTQFSAKQICWNIKRQYVIYTLFFKKLFVHEINHHHSFGVLYYFRWFNICRELPLRSFNTLFRTLSSHIFIWIDIEHMLAGYCRECKFVCVSHKDKEWIHLISVTFSPKMTRIPPS